MEFFASHIIPRVVLAHSDITEVVIAPSCRPVPQIKRIKKRVKGTEKSCDRAANAVLRLAADHIDSPHLIEKFWVEKPASIAGARSRRLRKLQPRFAFPVVCLILVQKNPTYTVRTFLPKYKVDSGK